MGMISPSTGLIPNVTQLTTAWYQCETTDVVVLRKLYEYQMTGVRMGPLLGSVLTPAPTSPHHAFMDFSGVLFPASLVGYCDPWDWTPRRCGLSQSTDLGKASVVPLFIVSVLSEGCSCIFISMSLGGRCQANSKFEEWR